MSTWISEMRTAARALARRPGFASVIVLTLALGIGANVAIFTVVNGVLLRPLPYPESERIVSIQHHAPGLDLPELENSPGTIRIYMDHARVLESVAAVNPGARNLTGGGQPDRVRVAEVSPSFFQVMRTQPALGRGFTREDALPGSPPVVVLTHRAWTSRYGGNPSVLGTTVRIDGAPTQVIGIMPEGFAYPERETAALLPLHVPEQGAPLGAFGPIGIARLADGVGIAGARREIEALQARFPAFDPSGGFTVELLEQSGWRVSVVPLRETIVGDVRATLWIVLGTVGFLLLIACANVANLYLVRAEARQREVAVRVAMGAGPARIALTFLSESTLLGLLSGVVGTALAVAGVRALVAYGPQELPRLHEISVDGTAILVALGLSIVAGLAFGMLPVVRSLGRASAGVLRDGDRAITDGQRRHRVRDTLVGAQLALALLLLVGSGLMVRSYQQLRSVDPGLEPAGVTAVEISMGQVEDRAAAAFFYRRIAEELRESAGIASVGATNALPLRPVSVNGGSFSIESRPTPEGQLPPVAFWTAISTGFFETLEIPLIRGRTVETSDMVGPGRYVWVNETFASTYLDGDALGERLSVGGEVGRYWEIAGIVGDVYQRGLDTPPVPFIYLSVSGSLPAHVDLSSITFVLKGSSPMADQVTRVREIVGRLAPDVPVARAASMEQIVRDSVARTAFTMALLAIAAAVALLLGSVGVYGVVAYTVSRRTREIGIRMALGATAGDVGAMVVRQGLLVTAAGTIAGLLASYGLTRMMNSIIFEVSATDPLTFAAVPLILLAVSLLASWLPARRASRIEPVRALSAE